MSHNLIKINKWLYPVSWIYGAGVWLRNKLFDWGYYPERSFPLPIICIGNLTVGGTGKTPHTEYLIRLLQTNYQVAVLSRGYKRKSKGFVLAHESTSVHEIGDEPYQMKQKFPKIHMAVDADRCHGIEELCKESVASGTDVILLDDAFQHRHVKAGLNLLLVDYNRLITEDTLLPAGRMREPLSGKDRAHAIIITKCPKDMKQIEYGLLKKQMNLYAFQQLFYTTLGYGKLRPLFNGGNAYSMHQIHPAVHILLVTGIASPQILEEDLSVVNQHLHTLTFSDHHDFTENDMLTIEKEFHRLPEGRRMIITTEKDSVRLMPHPHLPEIIKPYIYVLPIEIVFLQDQQETFNKYILDYVRKDSRNRRLSEGSNA
ncbi:MAG: tetraacyldisaccharide 4'-kinase [Bacteroidaceae bacterium]|nr:tetraacyldisaccharide 4'-kinase [Bacteroidaceae bacterium]